VVHEERNGQLERTSIEVPPHPAENDLCRASAESSEKGDGNMSLIQIVTLLATVITAGWFATFITQLIKQQQWRSGVKMILGVVIAALVGLATAWLTGDLTHFVTVWKHGEITAEQVLTLAVLIYTAAQIWFYGVYKKAVWAESVAAVGSKKA
jgi:hypothetical protein